jgi:hypothetical protein
MMPVVMHVFGILLSVIPKIYNDVGSDVGNIDGMYLIIR